MPAWIHDRAQHLLAKNPSMTKNKAFAIATQQSHALGKSPKGYGTSEGRSEAKQKYDAPKKQYVKGANPGKLKTPKLEDREKKAAGLAYRAMADELLLIRKQAGVLAAPGTRERIKAAYAALTPAGRLRKAQTVGRAPGALAKSTPSIADQVKPEGKGYGRPLPGAQQGGSP